MYTDPSGESVLDSIGNWWNKAKQTALGQFVDTFVVQPIVKKVKKIANAVAPIAKAVIKSVAEKAAEEYNTEAFLLFSAILKKVDNDGVYYSDKFRDVVESMQNELQSLDPSNVNYKQSTQEIVAKYCEYFNEYEKQRSNSDHAFESLTQWMDRSETEEKDYYWVLDGRNLFRQLANNSDVYSPQVKALFEKYSTMVISEQKTTLSNVILSKSDKETINKTKECLEEFYDSLKVILYPNGIKQTSENLPSEEISVIENPFGSVITAKNWNSYYGDKQSMSEEDWRIYIGYLIELNNEGRLQYGTAYTAGDGSHTSLKYTKDTLYIDCWGLIKTGAKINLSKEVVDSLSLNGPVNRIYESLSQKGEIIVEQNDDPRLGNTYPNLETGYSIFIDNTDRTEGYDHVMIYVKNLYYPDTNGTLIKNAVVGIGSIKEGLQIYDLDEYLPKWINEGKDVRWGNQFE